MKYRRIIAIAALAVLLCTSAHADQGRSCLHPKPLRFSAGTTSTSVVGGIPRGESECWTVAAKAGQKINITVTSVGQNAVFAFYKPGWNPKIEDGFTEIDGNAYAGAEEGKDAKTWSGKIASKGANLIVVGSTWGGTEYNLHVSIVD